MNHSSHDDTLPAIPPVVRRRRRRQMPTQVIVFYGLALLLSVALIFVGLGQIGPKRPDKMEAITAAGFVGLLLLLAVTPLTIRRRDPGVAALAQKIDALGQAVRQLSDQSVLSDDARRLLNRRAERELLCRAIEEDIAAEEWDAALVLCTELANIFGYRAEAEQFRAQIEQARSVVHERKVADAISQLDALIVQRRWDAALRDAGRIRRLYPDSPRVDGLRERVERARVVYKADLERRFLQAAQSDSAEEALELLRELDAYLSETEAAPYREVARGVISKARENLGAQFKIAVQDRQWVAAAALGRRIISEFPNTRMAQEIREHLDTITARANGEPAPV